MRFSLNVGGKKYNVEISDLAGDGTKITINEKDFFFDKGKEKQIPIAQTVLPKRDFSKKEIFAPVSGVVSEVFIKEGNFVKVGQKVLILSAMKMENEIISECEGRVEKILIEKGKEVKTGEKLVVLK